jgi:cytosine deaminase
VLRLTGAQVEDGRVVDVEVDEVAGLITSVAPSRGHDHAAPTAPAEPTAGAPPDVTLDLGGYLLLPAPAEPHAHLDKALLAERILNPAGDLLGAISAMEANRHTLTVDDIAERAERAARLLVRSGVTAIRSHADITLVHGLRSVQGLARARECLRDIVDLQIVALVSWPITGPEGAELRDLLRAALEIGADVVGGCPHLEGDPSEANATLLGIADDHDRLVDLHTDETLDPTVLGLRDLAARVAKDRAPGTVTASHCVSLGMQPPEVQEAVADEVAAAGVSVVTLPQTNLYLMGRDRPVATPRGLTALRPLLDAGVNVAAGADNLQDPFNLVGRADPLETAALLVMAGHVAPEEAYTAVSRASRAALGLPATGVVPGAPAELLAVRATSLREAIAAASHDRVVVHRGRVVSRTRVVQEA